MSKYPQRLESVSIDAIKKLFTSEEVSRAKRPSSGNVDLLIGFDCAAYHPVSVECVGHLLLMKFEIWAHHCRYSSWFKKNWKAVGKACCSPSYGNADESVSQHRVTWSELLSKMRGLPLRKMPHRWKRNYTDRRKRI